MTYTFGNVLGSGATIALPPGSWTLYQGTSSSTQNTIIPSSRLTPLTRGIATAPAVVTLDPRVVAP